jgi:hypothetical protein
MTPETVFPPDQPETQPEPAPTGPTGPRTEEGKARTRLNAYRHGLTGQVLVFAPEEMKAYEDHCAGLNEAYGPDGPRETLLLQGIADTEWRLQRAASMEHNLFARASLGAPDYTGNPEIDTAFSQTATWVIQSKQIALLSTYEGRLHRRLQKDKAELAELQAQRELQYKEDMQIAKRLLQYAKAKGIAYDPKPYFSTYPRNAESVFSEAAVAHEIARDTLERDIRPTIFPTLPDKKPKAA